MRLQKRFGIASVIGLSLIASAARRASADAQAPLDPNAFASLGSPGAGDYGFDTTNVTVTVNGGTPMHGVVFNGIAVFDFDNVDINGMGATGALPLAILSRGHVNMGGEMYAGASNGTPGPGGGFYNSQNLAAGGPGMPTAYGGAGFGGAGGASIGTGSTVFGAGGNAYGDAGHVFVGGSSGGPGFNDATPGAGGGAIEVSALGDISFGQVLFDRGGDGANGSSPDFPGGGGGSGGSIFFATPGNVSMFGGVVLTGGGGGGGSTGAYRGGGGAGGRALVESSNFATSIGLNNAFQVGGGGSYAGGFGANGTIEITGYVPPVPEPGVTSIVIGAAAPLLARRRRR